MRGAIRSTDQQSTHRQLPIQAHKTFIQDLPTIHPKDPRRKIQEILHPSRDWNDVKSRLTSMSYITVKYGANEEKLVNPNCLSSVLLAHIKKSCGFESLLEPIDLASESGEVVDLNAKPREYAKKYLEGRGNYVLIKVVGDDTEESTPTFVSLLDQSGLKFSGKYYALTTQ